MIFNINKNNEKKDNEIKLNPEMMNLLGCNRESFIKLLKKMNYKIMKKIMISTLNIVLKKKFKKKQE